MVIILCPLCVRWTTSAGSTGFPTHHNGPIWPPPPIIKNVPFCPRTMVHPINDFNIGFCKDTEGNRPKKHNVRKLNALLQRKNAKQGPGHFRSMKVSILRFDFQSFKVQTSSLKFKSFKFQSFKGSKFEVANFKV